MSARVGIVDYGRGNLHSIQKALEAVGADVSMIVKAGTHDFDLLVIPGVGAFSEGMQGLKERGLDEFTVRFAQTGRPVLGICLGSQLLMSQSEEFGSTEGLALIAGDVVKIPSSSEPIPHAGWKRLQHVDFSASTRNNPFPCVADGTWTYFVHSYHCQPTDKANVSAIVRHGENHITAAISKDNVFGFQFHPEKSGPPGLQMLSDFLRLA